jgi:hypothetical protein
VGTDAAYMMGVSPWDRSLQIVDKVFGLTPMEFAESFAKCVRAKSATRTELWVPRAKLPPTPSRLSASVLDVLALATAGGASRCCDRRRPPAARGTEGVVGGRPPESITRVLGRTSARAPAPPQLTVPLCPLRSQVRPLRGALPGRCRWRGAVVDRPGHREGQQHQRVGR